MEKRSTGHTVYQQIRRVSVLGILVAMVLATGAGLWLNLAQERRVRDDTLTTAVQAVSHTLTITDGGDAEEIEEYVDRTVHGISGIDLFAVYDADGAPVYFCDVVLGQGDTATLASLDDSLRQVLNQREGRAAGQRHRPQGGRPLRLRRRAAAGRLREGLCDGGTVYQFHPLHRPAHAGGLSLIGMAALGVGTFLSLRLAQRIKQDLLGYEPDAFRDLFLRRMELLDALDEGLLAIDREEHIIYINRAAAEMLSFDRNAVIGKPLSEVYPQSTIPRVLHTRQPEYNIGLESLHHVRILSDRMPVRRGGQIVGAVAIFRNRTEVANLARELTGVQAHRGGHARLHPRIHEQTACDSGAFAAG